MVCKAGSVKMAEGDLCTFDDLVDEDFNVDKYAEDQATKTRIERKITKLSMEIKSPPRPDNLTKDNIYVNMCCVFGVLAWMEDQKLLEVSKDIQSVSELDTSVTYANTSFSDAHLSNAQKYEKYLKMITPGESNLECGSSLIG
jgi:hypothetical protein